MALVSRKAFFQAVTPLIQIIRFRGKINIQKPRAPHFERAKYIKFTEPWFLSPYEGKAPGELCKILDYNKSDERHNPLQEIIAREMYEVLTNSRLVGFFHFNPMNADEQFKARVMLYKENMLMQQYGKKTLELAVRGTSYEIILDFYVSQNITVFSQEPKFKEMLNIIKKFPQLVLMDTGTPTVKKQRHSEVTNFSFTDQGLYCGEKCDLEKIKKSSMMAIVQSRGRQEYEKAMKEAILQTCVEHNDTWAADVQVRWVAVTVNSNESPKK